MSVKRRAPEGAWYYRFSFRRRDYCEGGFRTVGQAKDAEDHKRIEVRKLELHPEAVGEKMTWRQAGEWWLKNHAPAKRSARNDHSRLPLIMDFFGNKTLKETQPEDIDSFLSQVSDQRAAKSFARHRTPKILSLHTRNHYRTLIHSVYERLRKKRIYQGDNPAQYVDKIQVPTARTRFIYPAEEKILTPAISQEWDLYLYYRIGIGTSLRIGEMLALRVKDVDLTLKHLFIANPKNRKSRYVPLEGALPGVLRGLIAGKGPEDYVLPHWSYTYLRNHFSAICAGVGIKDLHIHDWRHTFAYGKLSQGESIYKVSLLMGHSSVNVTQKHYGHLAIGDLRSNREILPFLPCNRIATEDQSDDQSDE